MGRGYEKRERRGRGKGRKERARSANKKSFPCPLARQRCDLTFMIEG